MSPTKLEEYDASHDAFDPKLIYAVTNEMNRFRSEFDKQVHKLQMLAYSCARALDAEREKTRRLEAQVARWEKQDSEKKS